MADARRPVKEYSIKKLRGVCQKSAPDPAKESIPGKFCRIFSIYATWIFLRTPFHPNAITAISTAFFFGAIALLFIDSLIAGLFAVLLVFLSIVADGSDGEVARFRQYKTKAPIGAMYVEPISHDIQYGLSYALIGLALTLHEGSFLFLALGSLASISKLLFRFNEIRYWSTVYQNASEQEVQTVTDSYYNLPIYKKFFYRVNKNIFSSTGFLPVLLVAVAFDALDLMLWLYAVGNTLMWIALSVKQYWSIYTKFYKQST